MRTITACHLFTTLALIACLSGCAAVVVGGAGAAATYSYIEGKVSITRNIKVNTAYTAALEACADLGLTVEKRSKNLSKATVSGKDTDRPFWIWISAEDSVRTKISVRVGLLGDRTASQRIQNTIARHL
ncbi:DUF3568 family protein [Desulfoplanes sp.]